MNIEHLLAFNLALIVALMLPGPALLIAIHTSLSKGKRAGMIFGVGLGAMAACWTAMALLGLGMLFNLVPWAYIAAKFAGAIYLIYLAWRMWRGADKPVEQEFCHSRRLFIQGVLVNALNPKSALFAASVLVVIFPPAMTSWENSVIILNQWLVESIFYIVAAHVMTTQAIKGRYLRIKSWIDRTASVIFVGLGIKLLVDRAI